MPVSDFTRTLFPLPFRPMTPIRSPRKIVRSTSSSTGSPSNAAVRPRISATRFPPRSPLRRARPILRRSNTGRSTLSIRSIRRWVLRARIV